MNLLRRAAGTATLVAVLAACTPPPPPVVDGAMPDDPDPVIAEPTQDPTVEPSDDSTPDQPAPTTSPTDTATVEPTPAASSGTVHVLVEDELEGDDLTALASISGVVSVVARRTDDMALFLDDLPDGFKISVGALVDDGSLGLDPRPLPGQVVMTAAGAEFRDVGVGGTVNLARSDFDVVAVTDAPELQDVEFILHADDADSKGFLALRRATLELAAGTDAEAVADEAEALLGGSADAAPGPDDGKPLMLSTTQRKLEFGEFAFRDLDGPAVDAGDSWVDPNIRSFDIPLVGTYDCHVDIGPVLIRIFEKIEAEGHADEIDPDNVGPCWDERRVSDAGSLSVHAWGASFDVGGADGSDRPDRDVVAIFEEFGFRWGGDWPERDTEHFEWIGTDEG